VASLDDGRVVIIPGVVNRAASAIYHLAPRRLVLPMLAQMSTALKRG
jgi:hypothetical protein